MLWWLFVLFLPMHIHLFHRLQGEVSTLPLLNIKTDDHLRIIIIGLRNLGRCPCPRCLIPMITFQKWKHLKICCSVYPLCVFMMQSSEFVPRLHMMLYTSITTGLAMPWWKSFWKRIPWSQQQWVSFSLWDWCLYSIFSECLLRQAITSQLQYVWDVSGRPNAWSQDWHVKDAIHSSTACSRMYWRWFETWIGLTVHINWTFDFVLIFN